MVRCKKNQLVLQGNLIYIKTTGSPLQGGLTARYRSLVNDTASKNILHFIKNMLI